MFNSIVGKITGTGAALKVAIGFVPDHVSLKNKTTGRTINWFAEEGAGTGTTGGIGVTAAALSGAAGLTAMSDPAVGDGFIIGTDAANTAAQVIMFVATRNGPGSAGAF